MKWMKMAICIGVGVGWMSLGAAEASCCVVAQKLQFGSVDCLDGSASQLDRETTSCELSAVVYLDDGRLMLANDQVMPAKIPSSIFWIGVPKVSQRHIVPKGFVRQPALAQARRFEELAMTPKGTLIAMTSQERYLDKDPRWDAYCQILSWDWKKPGFALSISALYEGGQEIPLHDAMAQALTPKGQPRIPYLRMEGMAILPDQRLLCGVREIGEDSEYSMRNISLLQIHYDEPARGYLQLTSGFEEVYSMTAAQQLEQLKDYPQLQASYRPTGISGMVYDPVKKRIYFMTTSESVSTPLPTGYEEKKLNGYLWWMSLEDLAARRLAKPVLDDEGLPLHFRGHKPEGMTFLPDGSLFIICDEDRVESTMNPGEPKRNHLESPYFIYKLIDKEQVAVK